MPHIRIIGDVHGRIVARPKPRERNYRNLFPGSPYAARGHRDRNYKNLIQSATYSVQVGDLGFDYSALIGIDPTKHRVVAGNHDLLPSLAEHFLGDFGMHSFPIRNGEFSFFFVRAPKAWIGTSGSKALIGGPLKNWMMASPQRRWQALARPSRRL